MGRMNFDYVKTITWNKNLIPAFLNKDEFVDNEAVVVLDLPNGKIIEIYTSGKGDFKFSSDSKTESKKDSQIGKYLNKFVYDKLNLISKTFGEIPINFYGFINKKGFHGIDIYINENYLDWELTKKIYNDVKVKIPNEIHIGSINEISLNLLDSFIIRSFIEYPNERSIFYKRKKLTKNI